MKPTKRKLVAFARLTEGEKVERVARAAKSHRLHSYKGKDVVLADDSADGIAIAILRLQGFIK